MNGAPSPKKKRRTAEEGFIDYLAETTDADALLTAANSFRDLLRSIDSGETMVGRTILTRGGIKDVLIRYVFGQDHSGSYVLFGKREVIETAKNLLDWAADVHSGIIYREIKDRSSLVRGEISQALLNGGEIRKEKDVFTLAREEADRKSTPPKKTRKRKAGRRKVRAKKAVSPPYSPHKESATVPTQTTKTQPQKKPTASTTEASATLKANTTQKPSRPKTTTPVMSKSPQPEPPVEPKVKADKETVSSPSQKGASKKKKKRPKRRATKAKETSSKRPRPKTAVKKPTSPPHSLPKKSAMPQWRDQIGDEKLIKAIEFALTRPKIIDLAERKLGELLSVSEGDLMEKARHFQMYDPLELRYLILRNGSLDRTLAGKILSVLSNLNNHRRAQA